MPAVRSEWPDHLVPGARRSFASEYKELPAEYPRYFNIESSSRAFEEDLVSTGLGTAALKPETVKIALDKPVPRGKVRYTHVTFGLGYEVSEELKEDELYAAVVPPSSRFLARAMRDTEETQAAAVFNNAFTSQQAYDGVSLIDVAHTTQGAGTLANQPATDIDLSVAALQAGMERFMLLKDDRGLRISLTAAQVVHHPVNYWLAREILGSDKKPFTANNEPNVLGKEGLVPSTYKYLTDTDSWYLLAAMGQHQLNFFWRRNPRMGDDFDKTAMVLAMFISARFSHGSTDWRGIDGSTGI